MVVGNTEVRKLIPSKNGTFTTSETGNIPAGTYDLIALEGTVTENATVVGTRLASRGGSQGLWTRRSSSLSAG